MIRIYQVTVKGEAYFTGWQLTLR